MNLPRRNLLQSIGAAGLLGLVSPREEQAQEAVARATRGLPAPRIKDIGVIESQPAGVRLTVVKITTDQDGLYGYGCATFTQRADLVKPAVEQYLKPFLLGKTTDRIEDIWQSCYDSSYWKNGPVLNNAISGIDMALWDIKGRQAGMPVYQLVGGKCREAADTYAHADGPEYKDLVEAAKRYLAQGFRNVRVQVGVPGMAGYGAGAGGAAAVKALHDQPVFEPAVYIRRALKLWKPAARSWAKRWNCSTTCMSACRPTRPCNSARTPRSSSCSSWRTRSRRRTSAISGRSARIAPRPSPWANSSTARMSGFR